MIRGDWDWFHQNGSRLRHSRGERRFIRGMVVDAYLRLGYRTVLGIIAKPDYVAPKEPPS